MNGLELEFVAAFPRSPDISMDSNVSILVTLVSSIRLDALDNPKIVTEALTYSLRAILSLQEIIAEVYEERLYKKESEGSRMDIHYSRISGRGGLGRDFQSV